MNIEDIKSRLRGSIVPLVTPFKNGALDEAAIVELIDWQIGSGSHGISVTGTTGEPSSLSMQERKRVIELAVSAVNRRVPVLAGTGSNNLSDTLELTQFAQQAGADAVLLVVPYYIKPSQEGLFRYFETIAGSIDLPVILYNIPGRSAVNLEIETVSRLREQCENIIGIKEANHDFSHITRLLGRMGRDFLVYSGIELLCFPILAIGGAGYVSATGNVAPREVAQLYDLFVADQWREAQDLHYHLMPLNDAMFIEINPVPAKTALGIMGRIDPQVRLPLAPLSDVNRERLHKLLVDYGLV
jgi:4-hydroxy-tetrahydrodipicolinate synthase